MTMMPRRVAAATSMLSTPTPARTMARSLPGFSRRSALTLVPGANDHTVRRLDGGLQVGALEAGAVIEFEPGGLEHVEAALFELVADENAWHGSFLEKASRRNERSKPQRIGHRL
ncbi:MAG: hypothetical protein U0793_10100 [Gemmataceae bacterium]